MFRTKASVPLCYLYSAAIPIAILLGWIIALDFCGVATTLLMSWMLNHLGTVFSFQIVMIRLLAVKPFSAGISQHSVLEIVFKYIICMFASKINKPFMEKLWGQMKTSADAQQRLRPHPSMVCLLCQAEQQCNLVQICPPIIPLQSICCCLCFVCCRLCFVRMLQ